MSESTPFSEVGFQDPLVAGELFSLIGASLDDLRDPVKHAKLAEIASFVNMGPEAHALVRRVLMSGGVKGFAALEKAFQYSKLQKERIATRQKLSSLEKDLAIFE